MSETPARTLIHGVSLALTGEADGMHRADGERHDVLVANGHVERIGAAGTLDDAAATRVDGEGLVALGGFTDLYGRLREPGPSGRGNLASETRAALAGGFTRVLCAPDTDPVIDDTATVELIRRGTAASPGARVLPIAALTRGLDGRELAPLATLKSLGCVAAGQADRPLEDANVLLSAMQYATSFDMPLVMTARDVHIGADGCAHEGALAARLGLPGIPVAAETVALARLLELVRESRGSRRLARDGVVGDGGCRLHLSRLSSARGVALVAEAKAAGLPVTADVGIHHLLFTDDELDGFDARYPARWYRFAARRIARRCARASVAARSTRSAPTTRRSTATPGSRRSPHARRASPPTTISCRCCSRCRGCSAYRSGTCSPASLMRRRGYSGSRWRARAARSSRAWRRT